MRSPKGDKFYLIATDLRMYQNSSGSWDYAQRHGSKSIMIWDSPRQRGKHLGPEAYWDDALHEYVAFWASKQYADNDPGYSVIDSTVVKYKDTRRVRPARLRTFETTDLASGKWTRSTDYELPAGPRHGTVMPVTGAEYERLLRTYG